MKQLFLQLKNMTMKQALYPLVLFVYFFIVVIIFIFTARTLTMEINRALSPSDTVPGFSFDMAHYQILVKKLFVVEELGSSTPAQIATSTPRK